MGGDALLVLVANAVLNAADQPKAITAGRPVTDKSVPTAHARKLAYSPTSTGAPIRRSRLDMGGLRRRSDAARTVRCWSSAGTNARFWG